MDYERLKEDILSIGSQHLEKDRTGKGYICPICGSGSGNKGTGITTKDGIHYSCWVGCFSSADIIDIIGLEYGETEYHEKLKKAAEELGLDIADYETEGHKRAKKEPRPRKTQEAEKVNQQQEPQINYESFFLEASKNLDKTGYHRGISLKTLKRFNVGYVEKWKHPKAGDNVPTSPRLIIPTSKESYLARDTRENLNPKENSFLPKKSLI